MGSAAIPAAQSFQSWVGADSGNSAPAPVYEVVTFTGDGSIDSPYVPAYEANKFYTRTDGVYTKLVSNTTPANWGTGVFYTLEA